MLLKTFFCLLITFHFQLNRLVQSKAWPQIGWSNPYYSQEPVTTTTTQKPLYPTLYSRNNPHPVPYDDVGQRQVPVNPFDVHPSQPNIGGNQRNDYSNNNFNYPYDNTRTPTTYPPFDGSTRRNTFPTRRQFYNIPPQSSFNNSAPNNHNHTQLLNDHNNQRPNTGNNYPNQNTHNNGDHQHRPFPNPQFYDRNNQNGPIPNAGNNYQDRNRYNNTSSQYPSLQNSKFDNGNVRNQAISNGGSNYHNQNTNNNNPTNQNRQFPNPPFNDGRNQYQSNYQQNHGGLTNQNNYGPSAPPTPQYPVLPKPQQPQQPDFDPNGVALAPFPDENVDPNNFGARKHFNYENLHHRHPSKSNVDSNPLKATESRFGATKVVPLASYTSFGGVQVPLAPLAPY
ncbi:homeobox protein 2-like isoform X2 [Contarinia nasturtii]|uniref:homeobox protein 2-like isoform X2 n=1 Tax=Contarinia nasturtii TaxID=265458 RepID=UPI0012D3A02A|nr:homeobox protein 2-like isoform X2 [Contarinia nasturtii]